MAKNKTLEAARKAYNKSNATKYRVQAGGKKTKKKEQKVKSHYGGVAKKTQDTEENRTEARTKTGSVAKTVGSNVVKGKTTDTKPTTTGASKQNGSRSGAISPVSTKQKERQTGAATARTTAKGVGKTIKKATNVHKAKTEVTDVTQGTARGTAAGTAFNKSKAAEKALEKAGEKKTITVKKDQLTAEQKAAQEQAARATRFYTNSLVASGRITQKEADDAVEKAKKKASKGVKEDHTLTYSNATQSNEKVQRVANASKFTNVEVEDKKAKEKAIREARFYTNSQVAAGNMSQKEADKIVKEAGKGHRTTQSANILDKLGGDGEAERQGTRQAGQMNDSKFASGVMQGMSYGDNTRAVGKYNKQAAELVDTVKQSGAFNAGYMTGQGLQFMLGGTNKMTDALVKGVAKSGAARSALNIGLRKGGADMLFESPINTLDALKMSTDANGNFDKKAFAKYMALNAGLSGGMGGAIGGVGAKMTKEQARSYLELSAKAQRGLATEDDLVRLGRIQKKFEDIRQGNDVAKTDIIDRADYDAKVHKEVLTKSGNANDAVAAMNGASTHSEKMNYAATIKENADAQFEVLKAEREILVSDLKNASPEDQVKIRKQLAENQQELNRIGGIANVAERELEVSEKRNRKAVQNLAESAGKMKEATGVNYRVVNDKDMRKIIAEQGEDASEDYFYKGFYYKNKNGETEILINSESPQAHQTVIGHETGHLIKSSNEDEFFKLGADLENYAKKMGDWDAVYNQLKRSYPEATRKELREEVTCELLGRYVYGKDDAFIKQLAGEQPSVLKRIVDYLKELLTGTTDKEMSKELQSIIEKTESLVKGIDNTTEAKAPKKSADNVGYHAGDLGKAEPRSQMSGDRGTGHYGTGTYFVGNKAKISDDYYGKRPVETVDFTKYKMWKPLLKSDASKLHDFLKKVNRYWSVIDSPLNSFDAVWEFQKRGNKIYDDFWNVKYDIRNGDTWDTDIPIPQKTLNEYGEQYKKLFDETGAEHIFEKVVGKDFDGNYTEDIIDSLAEQFERSDYRESDWIKFADDMKKNTDPESFGMLKQADFLFRDNPNGINVTPQKLKELLEEVKKDMGADTLPHDVQDSASTRLMKKLGYEGVDVRGTDMDNTYGGSVIYDLKDEDLARKKEIGTARFSKEHVDKSSRLFAPVGKDGMRSKAWEVVANDLKGEKFGAKDLPKMLEGKGVKAEELKWTGLEAFLDGKKSVSRQELMDFFAANTGELKTVTRGGSFYAFQKEVNAKLFHEVKGNKELYDKLYKTQLEREKEYEVFFGKQDLTPEERAKQTIEEDTWTALENEGYDPYEIEELTGVSLDQPSTRWGQFTPKGGTNYREYEYVMDSPYSNKAMETHWGEDTGVVVHSRIKDYYKAEPKTNGGVEKVVDSLRERANEIQQKVQDHAGEKQSYIYSVGGWELHIRSHVKDPKRLSFSLTDEYGNRIAGTHSDIDGVDDAFATLTKRAKDNEEPFARGDRVLYVDEIQSDWHNEGKHEGYTDPKIEKQAKDAWAKVDGIEKEIDNLDTEIQKLIDEYQKSDNEKFFEQARALTDKQHDLYADRTKARFEARRLETDTVPDAPYKKTYTDYAMKRALREAVENDYEYLSWSTGKIHDERWQGALDYTVEYDTIIPKFMKKYVKQWNGKVEKIRLAENGEEVWGVKITPEMRESVSSQGQYRFSKEAKQKPKSKNGFDPKKFADEKNKLQEENNDIIEKIKSTADEDEVVALTKQSDEVEEKIRQMGSEPNRGEEPETPQEQVKLSGKETQKLVDSKYVSDEVKTALKDIEDAGVYTKDAEKAAKRYNDLDKKIAGLQKRLNNAKNKDYPTEAEKTAHIAELEDELKTLRNQQAKAAGKLEQMGKMKAVDDSIDPQEQFHKLRGDTGKVNRELKNADNLKNEDNWIKDKWNSVRRLWEDSLIEVENVAKRSDDKKLREEILTAANRVRNSQNVANFWITKGRSSFDNKVSGKSLDEIFPKELLENEAKYKDFQEYLIMKHVPARHAKGTDIYPEVSPELADKIVKKLEGKYGKELTSWADDVYGYLKDLQQYRVDSGMLSKEAADQFAKDYPFYVPTNRVNEDEAIDFFTGGLSNQIRTAKGGENDVLDMYSQLYTATNKTIHAAEENEMLNLYFRAKGVTPEQIKGAELPDLEHAVIEANVNKKTGNASVSFFIDGKPVKFPCSHQLALGLRELDGLEFERLMNAAKLSTLYGKPFKALITDWNLVFGVRNGMRDMQQAVVNSKDTRYFGSSFGAAGHAIAHEDSPYRKLYASMGGERAQLVSYDAVAKNLGIEKQGKVDALHEKVQDWVDADIKGKHINPVHYIEGINGAIEMMPRMCEFIGTLRKEANSVLKKQGSSLKKLRKEIIDEVNALEKDGKIGQSEIPAEVENRLANRIIEMVDKDTIDSAMRNANDITLNFGRSGVLGKALNMGFVPYLNPSIQGLSKLVRLFTEAGGEGGWKALASLGMKIGVFNVSFAALNEIALRDNEAYQNLNTRDKDNNFFIPLDMFGEAWEDKFFKFPKPRENAVLIEPVEYGLRYFFTDKVEYAYFDWDKLKMEGVPLWEKIPLTDEGKQSLRTAVDNIGVINPMTSNMVSPLWQTFHNKTWYGGSIESAYETAINEDTGKANVPVNKRYDTGTSGVAIWLGQSKVAKELNLSPKKIDNILDSYTGMIYDLGISQTTEEAKTRGNYLLRTAASQFLKDSVFSNKLSTKAWEKIDGMSKKEQDEYKSKYMYDAYKYDDAMDAITADKNMTVKEKMEAKRFLQKQRNKLYRAAINGEENTTNPLKDISKYLGANKTLNKFLPKSGDEQYDNWTDYYKNYKKTKGYKGLTPAQKEKEAQKFLDVYTLGVKGQSKISSDFHDSPSWGMTGVAAAQRYKQGKLSQKDAETIMQSCGVYESQTASYFKYTDHGGNVSRYAVTKKNNNKAEDLANELGVSTKGDGSIWKNKYSKEKGIKGGVLSMSLATGKADFKDRAYYISNSGDSNMLIKMNAARGYAEKYGHTTKQLIKLGKKADADGNTYLSNEEIESACNTIKGGKATSEEKAMGWVLLGGNPNKNPFGSIGDYSHDGDTGITMDDDGKSGGHGRRGRGRRGRRGGGGGGSSKGTMPKTESGAIKGKVTDVFANSNGSKASTLNDAYRKKVRKLRKELR